MAQRGELLATYFLDPDAPELTAGSILLDSASLRVDNPVLQEHMHGEIGWMLKNSLKSSLHFPGWKNHQYTAFHQGSSKGRMTIRNVTIKMTVPVELTYLPNLLEKRNKVPGDLLVVRSKFKVKRDDFGIRHRRILGQGSQRNRNLD